MPRYVMENSSYQWLQEGDCTRCTREKFCKKKCSAKRRTESANKEKGKIVVLKNKSE